LNFTGISVRPAQSQDAEGIFALVQELAVYERAPEQVINDPEKIRKHGFGSNPLFKCWVAINENQNEPIAEEIIGISLCYVRYSTWKGPVLYLEDIVVSENHRRKGIGTLLFEACMDYAKQHGFPRISWQVLDWNEPAIAFYKKYGANFDSEWVNCSIDFSHKPME
jgi:ribosomal protein S18 acetylase RimI-like enzyme